MVRSSCFSGLLFFLLLIWNAGEVYGQLQILSQADPVMTWRSAQIASLKSQIASPKIPDDLKQELSAQLEWLTHWKAGSLTAASLDLPSLAKVRKGIQEATVDPTGKARSLRQRLIGPKARPTAADTDELREMLQKHGQDVGLRQLHMQWLDQPAFQNEYQEQIVGACNVFHRMLAEMPQTSDVKSAAAFACFRRSRARMNTSDEETAKSNAYDTFRSDYEEIVRLVGPGHAEFARLDIEMLRHDGWFGRALVLLEQVASSFSSSQFLDLRLQLLKNLKWEKPVAELERALPLEKKSSDEKTRKGK